MNWSRLSMFDPEGQNLAAARLKILSQLTKSRFSTPGQHVKWDCVKVNAELHFAIIMLKKRMCDSGQDWYNILKSKNVSIFCKVHILQTWCRKLSQLTILSVKFTRKNRWLFNTFFKAHTLSETLWFKFGPDISVNLLGSEGSFQRLGTRCIQHNH